MNENIKNIAEIIANKEDDNDTVIILAELKLDFSEAIPFATALDKAGYSKQSDTVKEFVKKCGKDFAIQLGIWGNEAQRNALDKAWKTINELAEQYGAGEDK